MSIFVPQLQIFHIWGTESHDFVPRDVLKILKKAGRENGNQLLIKVQRFILDTPISSIMSADFFFSAISDTCIRSYFDKFLTCHFYGEQKSY